MTQEEKLAYGERLKKVRAATGMTQGDFARAIGISRNPITAAEKGKSRLQPLTVKRICEMFDVDEDWLLSGQGDMKKSPYNVPADEVNQLLAVYSKLSEDKRIHFIALLESLSAEENKQNGK